MRLSDVQTDTSPPSAGTNVFSDILSSIGNFAKEAATVAAPFYAAKEKKLAQTQQYDYQLQMAKLRAENNSGYPSFPGNPRRPPFAYSQGGASGGFSGMIGPLFLITGIGAAAFLLLRK